MRGYEGIAKKRSKRKDRNMRVGLFEYTDNLPSRLDWLTSAIAEGISLGEIRHLLTDYAVPAEDQAKILQILGFRT